MTAENTSTWMSDVEAVPPINVKEKSMSDKAPQRGERQGPEEQRLQGHLLLAKMGKTVLRPGGMQLTRTILDSARPTSTDRIVEFGPGIGRTAELLLAVEPEQYTGVDVTEDLANPLHAALHERANANIVVADAKQTGLPSESATLVVGEAMLTMQSDEDKRAIVNEAYRILQPAGRYVIHELSFTDETPEEAQTHIKKTLSRVIKVGARPRTLSGWAELLEDAGFNVVSTQCNSMALLHLSRLIEDEGLIGLLKIAWNVARNPVARKRILAMRKTFKDNRASLCAVGIVAVKNK